MANSVDLNELFAGLQNQMEAQLNTNRSTISHPGTKGDSLENVWIEWLREYLPNRYCVDKAIVVDCEGQLSDQMDLVIYDQQYTPFVFSQNGVKYIPAEGVYAVFEVKPDLEGSVTVRKESISYIEYAGRKVESVRKLKRTSTFIVDRGDPKAARPLTKIIGGILTSVNSYAKSETIENHLKGLSGLKSIDMGCIVEHGGFYIEYTGKEDLAITDLNDRITDYYNKRSYVKLVMNDRDKSLIAFFLQLSRYLQQSIGTVAAIDFEAYADKIGVTIDKEI